jgi:RNA polymerase sigma-70 factor (ECF subfamily)
MTASTDARNELPVDLDPLVQRARAGDREAFRDLVLATQRSLTLSIASHASSREMIEEVLQETYVTAFEKIAQYRMEGSFMPWLKAIARNRLYLIWRERKRTASLHHEDLDHVLVDRRLEDLDQDADLRALEARRLEACLGKLPARARLLLERRYCDDLPLPQLAQQFKKTTAVLSVTLYRLRQQLRSCIERSQQA